MSYRHPNTFYENLVKHCKTEHVNNYLHPWANNNLWIKAKVMHDQEIANRKPDAYYEDIEARHHKFSVGDIWVNNNEWWKVRYVNGSSTDSIKIVKPICFFLCLTHEEVINFSNHYYDRIFKRD